MNSVSLLLFDFQKSYQGSFSLATEAYTFFLKKQITYLREVNFLDFEYTCWLKAYTEHILFFSECLKEGRWLFKF